MFIKKEVVCLWLEASRFIVLVASISISCGLWSQAIKIWKTKSAKDFSAILVISLFFNEIAWLNYGFALYEWPIMFIGIANVPAVVIIVCGFMKYRR